MKNIFSNPILASSISRFKSTKKLGMTPGSIVYTGEKKVEAIKITVTDFGESVERQEISSLDELPPQKEGKRWLHISGLHDTDLLKKLGNQFSIHSLALEDIVNTNQPAKIEEFEDYLFIISKISTLDVENNQLTTEHISFILLHNMVISFQETATGHFEPIWRRLENPKGRMRQFGADYFLYTLLDVIVDNYFVAIDALNDQFERLEQEVISNPQQWHVEEIHKLKRKVIVLRKSVRPLREVVNTLMNGDIELISSRIDVFLRDLYDHTIQTIDSLDTQRDLVSGLMDTYLSQVSHRMNEVMKVLTIMSTIFIPLGFLAGLYGMNFEYMPELHFRYGYFVLLGFMFAAVVSMILLFRHKKWL
ncbi:magnesium/cobalt transporter CorA [candidate division KSB1 bacterium]|nr:magnesium/cobalt transporter CorA [candidate division KSB1 bacterium]RQW00291.1 MAG: magnesium/cobalt transporter CorA [candidate division KSB1 bacterium]